MSTSSTETPLVSLRGVRTYFYEHGRLLDRLLRRRAEAIRAVDGVDLDIRRGEIIGLVGESGSGKTTLGRTIVRLAEAIDGEITFDGLDVRRLRSRDVRHLRRRIQLIFQDPYSSLSPRRRVVNLLTEPYVIHRVPTDQRYSVRELLEMVELSTDLARKFPHELSGGQARRIGIARALSLHPEFIVADEPTSGLDVSAASSVLNLIQRLRADLGLTYLIITHNLNVVGYVANRIAVMYLGQLVEVATADQIFDAAAHPYTRALLASISEQDPRQKYADHRLLLPGEIPSPKRPPPGCRFHPRCAFADDLSRERPPALEEIESGHFVACHHWRRVRDSRPALPERPAATSHRA